jgi:hypothetical protein
MILTLFGSINRNVTITGSLHPIIATKLKEKQMHINLETTTPLYFDLVNNLKLFHQTFDTEAKLLSLTDWKDNSDYSHHEHIDDFLKRDFTEDDMARDWIVRVPVSYIFSSEKSKGGFDRPVWANTKGVDKCRENLSILNGDGGPKGYTSADASILSGILRPKNVNGTLYHQLVKYIGNNRIVMKNLANKGKDTEVLMEVGFHKTGLEQEKYITIEAERHTTDAGDRSGQNETQKFASSYRAGRKHAVDCFHFLKNNKLDYDGIMIQEKVDGAENFLTLTSLSGIKEGVGNGFFKKFGEENVVAAIGTIHKIKKTTEETAIGMSPVESLSLMFKCFTNYGKEENSKTMLFTKPELQDFFDKYFKKMNEDDDFSGNKGGFFLKNLSASGSLKDMVFISAQNFWPALPNYWMKIRKAKIGFSDGCFALDQFISSSKDPNLKRDIINKVK